MHVSECECVRERETEIVSARKSLKMRQSVSDREGHEDLCGSWFFRAPANLSRSLCKSLSFVESC